MPALSQQSLSSKQKPIDIRPEETFPSLLLISNSDQTVGGAGQQAEGLLVKRNKKRVVLSPRCREWAHGRFRRGVGGHKSGGYRLMCRVASVSPARRGVWGLGVVIEPT